jgi:hypothetical protein
LSAVKGAPGRARWYLLFNLSRDQHSEFFSSLLRLPGCRLDRNLQIMQASGEPYTRNL